VRLPVLIPADSDEAAAPEPEPLPPLKVASLRDNVVAFKPQR
jgi:hypothetical protein